MLPNRKQLDNAALRGVMMHVVTMHQEPAASTSIVAIRRKRKHVWPMRSGRFWCATLRLADPVQSVWNRTHIVNRLLFGIVSPVSMPGITHSHNLRGFHKLSLTRERSCRRYVQRTLIQLAR